MADGIRWIGTVGVRNGRNRVGGLMGSHRPQHEGVEGVQVGPAPLRVRGGRTPTHDGGVDEGDDLLGLLGGDEPLVHGVGEDRGEHLGHERAMGPQTAGGTTRDGVGQRSRRREVEVSCDEGLLTHVPASARESSSA